MTAQYKVQDKNNFAKIKINDIFRVSMSIFPNFILS